ncbi:MAG: hypothetical protein AB8H86_22075 [Polyangiales bacterium]
MRQCLGLVLILAVACGGSAPAATTPVAVSPSVSTTCEGAPIRLSFAWPEGISARVSSVERTASQAPDGSNPVEGTSEADYVMRVVHDAGNVAVRFDAGARGRGRSNGLIPTFSDARTTVVLGAEGNVVRVEGPADIRAAVAVAEQNGAITPASAASLALSFADEGQLTNARSAWAHLLTVWHGREFRCGESQSLRFRSTAHFAASMNLVETNATLQYVEEIACPTEREPGARCVHLRIDAEADAASLRSARQAWARTMGDDAGTPAARVRRVVDLIVEPDGLIPHELAFEELSELVWEVQGQRSGREIHDVSAYQFAYGQATTDIAYGGEGVGFQVVRDGRVVRLPDTPECRALTACCNAADAASNPGTINLMCAMARTSAATDAGRVPCSAELSTVRSMLDADSVTLPQGCQP